MNSIELPATFLERFQKIIPAWHFSSLLQSFTRYKPLTVRINTLKTQTQDVLDVFDRHHIEFKKVSWCHEAFILEDIQVRISAKSQKKFAITKIGDGGEQFESVR